MKCPMGWRLWIAPAFLGCARQLTGSRVLLDLLDGTWTTRAQANGGIMRGTCMQHDHTCQPAALAVFGLFSQIL